MQTGLLYMPETIPPISTSSLLTILSSLLFVSGNMTQLAHKINITKDLCDGKNYVSREGEKLCDDESTTTPLQSSLWPWDSVTQRPSWSHGSHWLLLVTFANQRNDHSLHTMFHGHRGLSQKRQSITGKERKR